MNSEESEDTQNNSNKRRIVYNTSDETESKKVCLEQFNYITDCNNESNNINQDMGEMTYTKLDSQSVESRSSSPKNNSTNVSDEEISQNTTKESDNTLSEIEVKENKYENEDTESPSSEGSNNMEIGNQNLTFDFVIDAERNVEIIRDPDVEYDSEANDNIIDIFENFYVQHECYSDSNSPIESITSTFSNDFDHDNVISSRTVRASEYDADSEGYDNETSKSKSSDEEPVVDEQEIKQSTYKCSKCEMEGTETSECVVCRVLDDSTDDETSNTN